MIATEEFSKMVSKQWRKEKPPMHLPPEARFVTGHASTDSHLHFLETKYGVRVILTQNTKQISSYEVLDDKKFMMFTLKWS